MFICLVLSLIALLIPLAYLKRFLQARLPLKTVFVIMASISAILIVGLSYGYYLLSFYIQ